jgi:hypothetical protein
LFTLDLSDPCTRGAWATLVPVLLVCLFFFFFWWSGVWY